MVAMKKSALALAMATAVSAQTSSVVNVLIPGADEQTLMGSLIASDASKTTMAISCPSNADMSECGFGPDAVTITFGPSTFKALETFDPLSLVLDCNVKGTTAVTCTETYIGPADVLNAQTATDADALTATDTDTQIITTTSVTVLSQSEIVFMPVTITAFADSSDNTSAGTTGASGTESTATSTGSGTSGTASNSASGSASATNDSNSGASVGATRWEFVSAVGAGLIGLTMMLL
ncbi:hypothetical protein AYO20_00120 [Fonsecaea nubica]|uniref:Uncharacterized protein n=1 Tax=Fonsecaea nubica TaxID=856822 RepID=A0A178DGD1_9EURO|nr:hypothetical protein AYO20_00120 [Fonsecaea nubica]OAL40384.1 hypothetical protein AYO20_00120 [Fonsecaea nubica]